MLDEMLKNKSPGELFDDSGFVRSLSLVEHHELYMMVTEEVPFRLAGKG